MKPRFLALVTAILALTLAPDGYAAPEQGDAGELPSTAQNLTGQAVSTISGRLDGPEAADLYRICLSGGGSFSATTEGATEVDTQLFLFTGAGRGVYANDESAGTPQSTLPAGNPLTPVAPGEYLLGVSSSGSDPYSAEGMIFPNLAHLVGADGRGAGAPLERWDGRPRDSGDYSVALTGTSVCDSTAPAIDLRTPADGAVYTAGAEVTVDYDCSDEPGGSGLASCTGDLADGAALDTSSPGTRSFTVSSRDSAGNTNAATVHYEVDAGGYDFEGFQWPVEVFPGVTRWAAGLPVPIRFSLGGDQGDDVLADGYPQVAEVECGAGETPERGVAARSVWGQGLRYRPRQDRYVYRWRTERRWAGSCRHLLLRLDDGSLQRAEFKFPRRWRWL